MVTFAHCGCYLRQVPLHWRIFAASPCMTLRPVPAISSRIQLLEDCLADCGRHGCSQPRSQITERHEDALSYLLLAPIAPAPAVYRSTVPHVVTPHDRCPYMPFVAHPPG
jgi:hypothetical protein